MAACPISDARAPEGAIRPSDNTDVVLGTHKEAQQTAHRYFRWSLTGWPVMAELPDMDGFAAASKHLSPTMVTEHISCGPSVEIHLKAIESFIEAGYDHIILVQIGPEQEAFIEFFERRLAPALANRKAA